MGSRSFYEGWDSNRPNVINFINIGMGEEARKFVLQSVGRGVRIEPLKNKISSFHPDFIFWLQKGKKYFIVFVDPKGIEHSGWADKLNGYKNIFEGKFKEINYNGFKVGVKLFFISRDALMVRQRFPEHTQYWFSDIGKMLETII